MAKTIRNRVEEIHTNALAHGWWDDTKDYGDRLAKIPEKILLVHCELSEAVEEFRVGKIKTYYDAETNKPEGVFVELADAMIRLMDLCGACGVDIEQLIEEKHNYNKTRSHRHGNKTI